MKKGIGLRHALRGLYEAARRERNMRIHVTAIVYVSFYALLGNIAYWAWCAVLLCFGLVTALEAVNSAIERLGNGITQEKRADIGMAKDMAAGAVLVAALSSVGVAVVVFSSVWDQILASPLSKWGVFALPLFLLFIVFPQRNRT